MLHRELEFVLGEKRVELLGTDGSDRAHRSTESAALTAATASDALVFTIGQQRFFFFPLVNLLFLDFVFSFVC